MLPLANGIVQPAQVVDCFNVDRAPNRAQASPLWDIDAVSASDIRLWGGGCGQQSWR